MQGEFLRFRVTDRRQTRSMGVGTPKPFTGDKSVQVLLKQSLLKGKKSRLTPVSNNPRPDSKCIMMQNDNLLCGVLSCIQLFQSLDMIPERDQTWFKLLHQKLEHSTDHAGDKMVIDHINTIFKRRPLYQIYFKRFMPTRRVTDEEGVEIRKIFYRYNSRLPENLRLSAEEKEKYKGSIDVNHEQITRDRYTVESQVHEILAWLLDAFGYTTQQSKVETIATVDGSIDEPLESLYPDMTKYSVRMYKLSRFYNYESDSFTEGTTITYREGSVQLENQSRTEVYEGNELLKSIRQDIQKVYENYNIEVKGGVLHTVLWEDKETRNQQPVNEMSGHSVAFTYSNEQVMIHDTMLGKEKECSAWIRDHGIPCSAEILIEMTYAPKKKDAAQPAAERPAAGTPSRTGISAKEVVFPGGRKLDFHSPLPKSPVELPAAGLPTLRDSTTLFQM